MVNLSQQGLDELENDLDDKNIKGFERELIIILRKMEKDIHYAEENRERQTKEIIGELQNIKNTIEMSN